MTGIEAMVRQMMGVTWQTLGPHRGGQTSRFSNHQKAEAARRYASGVSAAVIAREMGVQAQTVRVWARSIGGREGINAVNWDYGSRSES